MSREVVVETECTFCKIVKGEMPCHKIWEDEKYLAFLSIFPNTDGFTVVISKEHYPSYGFDVENQVLVGLLLACKSVVKLIDKNMDDVGRTALIMEGFGVDHLHMKLFPMHGTKMKEWRPIHFSSDKYFEKYEGYVSSYDCKKMEDEKLGEIARKIRGEI